MSTSEADFVTERTLGSRAADFWWRADELGNLTIRRVATRGQTHAAKTRLVPREELEALLAWMAGRDWVRLECLPAPLRAGTARDGIGPFLVRQLGWPPSEATFASHVAALLAAAGLWAWNGKKRGMAFRLVAADLALLRALYERRRAEAEAAEPDAVRRQPERAPRPKRATADGAIPPQVDLPERFRALGRELRAQIDSVGGGHHPAEKGGRREAAFRAFLRRVLPRNCLVASGEIFATTGESSPQVDVLIYDSVAPALVEGEASVVVPAESVFAAIELKPLLRGPELAEAVANLRKVKALRPMAIFSPLADRRGAPRPEPNPPAFTALFSLDSVHPRRILELLHDLEADVPAALAIDCVCMLDRGIIYRYPGLAEPAGMPQPGAGRRPAPLVCLEAGEDSLVLFYVLLVEQLALRRSHLPDLRAYLGRLRLPEPTLL